VEQRSAASLTAPERLQLTMMVGERFLLQYTALRSGLKRGNKVANNPTTYSCDNKWCIINTMIVTAVLTCYLAYVMSDSSECDPKIDRELEI
jgi:hypothetical protein